MITARVDIARMLRKLQAVPKVLEEEMSRLVLQEARGFVKDVVSFTPPASRGITGTAAKKQGERKIDSDLGGIFAPVKIKGRRTIPHLFGDYAPDTGRKPPYIVPTVESHPDPGGIYTARKQRRHGGRLTRGQKAPYYVAAPKIQQLKTKLKKKVGQLAAGYNAAAQRLNVPLPAWVRRHGNKYGRVQVRTGASSFTVAITNSVPYGQAQHMQRIADRTLAIRRNKLERRLPFVLRAAIKKAGLKTR